MSYCEAHRLREMSEPWQLMNCCEAHRLREMLEPWQLMNYCEAHRQRKKCRSHGSSYEPLWYGICCSNCEQPSVYKRFLKRANSENWLSPVIKATRKQELWNGQEARKGLFPSGGKFFVDVLMAAFEPGSKDHIPGAVARTLRRRIYTEKKAKVVAAAWGKELIHVLALQAILHQNDLRPWCKITRATRNWIDSVPQAAATTFAFYSAV